VAGGWAQRPGGGAQPNLARPWRRHYMYLVFVMDARNLSEECVIFFASGFMGCPRINWKIKIKIQDHFQESGIKLTKSSLYKGEGEFRLYVTKLNIIKKFFILSKK
jgi:hypothetical protein